MTVARLAGIGAVVLAIVEPAKRVFKRKPAKADGARTGAP